MQYSWHGKFHETSVVSANALAKRSLALANSACTSCLGAPGLPRWRYSASNEQL